MNKKSRDRHLDVPAESNRDKHINFVAEERNEIDPAEEKRIGKLSPDHKQVDKESKPRKK
jgi:hypothetical protein